MIKNERFKYVVILDINTTCYGQLVEFAEKFLIGWDKITNIVVINVQKKQERKEYIIYVTVGKLKKKTVNIAESVILKIEKIRLKEYVKNVKKYFFLENPLLNILPVTFVLDYVITNIKEERNDQNTLNILKTGGKNILKKKKKQNNEDYYLLKIKNGLRNYQDYSLERIIQIGKEDFLKKNIGVFIKNLKTKLEKGTIIPVNYVIQQKKNLDTDYQLITSILIKKIPQRRILTHCVNDAIPS